MMHHITEKERILFGFLVLGYYSNQFSRHWLSLLKSQMCSIKSPFCSSALFEDVSGISPSSTSMASCTSLYSVLLTFMAAKILSDERQIGPRLEKEIEMYCSNKALERLKDMVDAPAKARRSSSGANGNDILHKYRDFFATYFPLFRRPKSLGVRKTKKKGLSVIASVHKWSSSMNIFSIKINPLLQVFINWVHL